jgi:hypothetical protein
MPHQGPHQMQFKEHPRGNQQGQRPRGDNQRQRQGEAIPKESAHQGNQNQTQDRVAGKLVMEVDKQINVTCFNCVGWGHYSSDCKEPKVCFVCQTANHVGRECPEWRKLLEPAQYLGSEAQGLGFFHVDVLEEVQRNGYLKFLNNCAILTVEEGEMEEGEIVENLKILFNGNWNWQLRSLGDFKFLIRFPPYRKISDTLISDITYFRMKKEGVLVSLRAWTGDIEPYDVLEETWV